MKETRGSTPALAFSPGLDVPLGMPPPSPVILFSRAEPPARILASRRSLRSRACSAALEGGVGGSEDMVVGVSAMVGGVEQSQSSRTPYRRDRGRSMLYAVDVWSNVLCISLR